MFLGFFLSRPALKIIPLLKQKVIQREIVDATDFKQLLAFGSHAYKVYTIPKRKAGNRTIAHPSVKLKECQRQLVPLLEIHLPVHDSSYAYAKGRSIKDNALLHSKSSYLLKMDFQDFFNSITPKILEKHLTRLNIDLSPLELKRLKQLIFWNPSKRKHGKLILSVGSPISPFISNSVMYFFDEIISEICLKKKINYSRYADDLTFSTNIKGLLFAIPEQIKKIIKEEFNGEIIINERKTIFSSKGHNRHVTGITLNNEGKISLGRKRKRYISSLVFRYINNNLDTDEVEHLIGILSFCYNIEPHFLQRLTIKYKINVINELLRRGYQND